METDQHNQLIALLPRLRRFAYSLTGSLEAADDVLQSACEKALSRFDQFEPGTRLDHWMFQIVRTVSIDRFRYEGRRKTDGHSEAIELIAVDARTHERIEARMDLEIIRREISELPEEQRSVLGLVTVDGMSYQDVAETLGIPIGTVMSRLSRARKKLATAIERGDRASADAKRMPVQ